MAESKTQNRRILKLLASTDKWLLVDDIVASLRNNNIEATTTSVSAMVRNLRKPRYGGYYIKGRYRAGTTIYEYRYVGKVDSLLSVPQTDIPTKLTLEQARILDALENRISALYVHPSAKLFQWSVLHIMLFSPHARGFRFSQIGDTPMHYRSTVIFDSAKPRTQSLLASRSKIHRALMLAFPSREDGGCGRILFSCYAKDHMVIVISDKKPVWGNLQDVIKSSVEIYNPEYVFGQVVKFKMEANAVIQTKRGRVRINTWNGLQDWAQGKFQDIGSTLAIMDLDKTYLVRENIIQHGQPRTLSLAGVSLSGELIVEDPERFKQGLIQGIGHAKAYGFGLLQIVE
jgi:CRISPR system Cascade subunit CasE